MLSNFYEHWGNLLWLGILLIAYIFLRIKRNLRHTFPHNNVTQARIHRLLGRDRLQEIFRASDQSRVNELFLHHSIWTGPTLKQKFLGAETIGTTDPENIRAILSNSSKDWCLGLRNQALAPLLKHGIFTQEGDEWQLSRKVLHQHFQRHRAVTDFIQTPVQEFLRRVESGKVDLQPLFDDLALEITIGLLFGPSTKLAPQTKRVFAQAIESGQLGISRRLRLGAFYWVADSFHFRRSCNAVHTFAAWVINGCRKNREHLGFSPSSDMSSVVGQTVNLLVAGRDTTSSLLSWCLYLLVRHPEVLNKLRREIDTAQAQDTHLDLDGLPFLRNVIEETLRLYPPIPVNARTAAKDTFLPLGSGPDGLGPIQVQKGAVVAFSLYALHRRPDIYGLDAELFRPERWDEPLAVTAKNNWAYLPFHDGPRNCLGKHIAINSTAYTIIQLIRTFRTIRLPSNIPVKIVGTERQRFALVLTCAEGCVVELEK